MTKPRDPMVSAVTAIAERMLGDMGHNSSARRLHAEVNRLRGGVEALDSVNANRNPTHTQAAHALKVAKLARKLDGEITALINRTTQIVREGHAELQRRIAEKVNLIPDEFASEIRTAFRSLSDAEKAKLIERLVDENRGPELAAIVKAPSVLTGISDGQRANYEQSILAKHAGDELDEQAKLNGVLDAALSASRAAGSLTKQLTDPGMLAEIERGENAASEASAAFDHSMQ